MATMEKAQSPSTNPIRLPAFLKLQYEYGNAPDQHQAKGLLSAAKGVIELPIIKKNPQL